MMKFFTVIVTRDTTESTILTIEARNATEASLTARELIQRDATGLVWEPDDTPNASSDVYVTDVSEEPTDLAVRHEREQQELLDGDLQN